VSWWHRPLCRYFFFTRFANTLFLASFFCRWGNFVAGLLGVLLSFIGLSPEEKPSTKPFYQTWAKLKLVHLFIVGNKMPEFCPRNRKEGTLDPAIFNAVQPLLARFSEFADKQLAAAEIQQLLSELANKVGQKKIASVNITVDVFDEDREAALPLVTTGLSAVTGKAPFRIWGDSTPHRYVLDEGIRVVPHDRCPSCWQEWDFKLQNSTCDHCGIKLGDKCKLLLDTDQCPWCEEGKVTVARPRCDKCGHEIDPKMVVWG
jgi:hypothetical protein